MADDRIAGQMLIGSSWSEASSGDRFDVTDPASGVVVGSVPDAASVDVQAAIDAAEAGSRLWRETTAIDRGRLLRSAAELIRERRDRIAAVLTAEQGKPLAESVGEVDYAAGFLEWFAGEAERTYGFIVPTARNGKRVLVLRQPIGIAAAITPWNFPAAMLTRKLGPAIAAGCASIVKPASATPLTAIEICRAIVDAGAPTGLVNLVTTSRASMAAEVLMGDHRVRMVSFTGSTQVGKRLIQQSAAQVKRLSLELGGHAPFLIFDDADVEDAVGQLVASKFRNAGQTCVCANRVYVQRQVYGAVLESLSARVEALVVGAGSQPGVNIGPLIDANALEKVDRHVRDAESRGARVVTGGRRLVDAEYARGHYFEPSVLDGVTHEMLISNEETFGPVVGLTAFTSEEEGVRLANNTTSGLAAYFATRDYARVLRVAERLDFGVIGVNDGLPSSPNAPFGGMKESGLGREGGAFGIDEYLEVKYVSIGGVDG